MTDPAPSWNNGVTEAAVTDVGMRRSQNQDSMKVVLATTLEQWERRGHLLMVADGMGAHAAGELASKLAVDNIPHLYSKYCEHSPPEGLQKAIVEANAEIHNRGQVNAEFHQMGTTASCLVLLPQGALIGHVGDSRVYRMRGDYLHQLTFDHSLVWELRAANQIPDDGEAHNIPKNVITRSLGPNAQVQVDIEGPIPIESGDVFLLCSDGLTGPVQDDEIAAILSLMTPEEAGATLVNLANLRGGPDNISVVIARIEGDHVCTANTGAAPLSIGREEPAPTPPALWVVPIVCAFMAAAMYLASQNSLAVMLFGAALLALGYIGVQRLRGVKGIQLDAQRRLGKGPYVEEICKRQDAARKVRSILESLRTRAEQIGWELNWSEVDRHLEIAESGEKTEGGAASSQYSLAFRSLMAELKSYLARQASDSAVEL